MPDPKLTGEVRVYDPSARPELVAELELWLKNRKRRIDLAFANSDLNRLAAVQFMREAFADGWSAHGMTRTYKWLEELQKGTE